MFILKRRKTLSILLAATLFILLAHCLLIPVAAAEDDAWDLRNFIKSVVVRDGTGQIVNDGVFYHGAVYTFVISFAEGIGEGEMQFDYNSGDFLTYQLPDGIVVGDPVTDRHVTVAGDKPIGMYSISGSGHVEVRFGAFTSTGDPAFDEKGAPENFIHHYTNASFTLNINAKFDKSAQSGEILFGADTSVTINAINYPEPSISVVKTSSGFIGAADTIGYSVVITAHGDNSLKDDALAWETQKITDIMLTDLPFTSSISSGVSRSNTDKDYSMAYHEIRYRIESDGSPGEWTGITGAVTWTGGAPGVRNRFAYGFTGTELYPGDSITVEYVLNIAEFLAVLNTPVQIYHPLNHSFYIGNDVMIDSSAGSGTAEKRDLVSRAFHIAKSGVLSNSVVNQGKRSIRWTVTVGNALSGKLNGSVLGDSITADHGDIRLPALGGITVTLFMLDDNVLFNIGSFTADRFGSAFIRHNDHSFSFTVPAAGDNVNGVFMPDIYRVALNYTTEGVPGAAEETPSKTYTNYIYYNGDLNAKGDVFITRYPEESEQTDPTMGKSTSRVRETAPGSGLYEIEYSVMFTVPAATPDQIDGWKGYKVFFRDFMSFGNPADMVLLDMGWLDRENVSVTLDTPEQDFEYTILIDKNMMNIDTMTICFGGRDVNDTNNSRWQYSTEKTVTISYTVPLGFALPSGVSILDALQNRTGDPEGAAPGDNYLQNSASLTYTGWQSGGTVNAYTYDNWPITKEASTSAYDDSVFDYTVTLNPGTVTGSSAEGRFPLFEAGSPAVFTDIFDTRLEYVPGSLYVRDATSGYYYGPYTGSGGDPAVSENQDDEAMTVAEGSISLDFSKLARLEASGGDLRISGESAGDWYASANTFGIYYKLRVKEPNGPDRVSFQNAASIHSTTQDSYFTAGAEVTYVKQPLAKNMLTDGSNITEVEIIVNPHGRKLNPGAAGGGGIVAVDKMNGDLAVFLSSIELFTQTQGQNGYWDGTWIPQGISPVKDGLWSVISVNAQEIRFVLPDETPVKIVYKALITVPVGFDATFSNGISVYGFSDSLVFDNYRVTGTNAYASADRRDILVYKEDAGDDSLRLSGAVFQLYMARQGYIGDTADRITAGGSDFYLIAQASGGIDGEYRLSSNLIAPSHEAIYLIVETQAPDGYVLPSAPDNYTFFVVDARSDAGMDALEAGFGVPVKYIADNIHIANTLIPPPPPDNSGDGGDDELPPVGDEDDEPPPGGGDDGDDGQPQDGGDDESDIDITDMPPGGNTGDVDEPPNATGPGGTDPNSPPNPSVPWHRLIRNGNGWIELNEHDEPFGIWEWAQEKEMWVFKDFPPVYGHPQTGVRDILLLCIYAVCASLAAVGTVAYIVFRFRKTQLTMVRRNRDT